MWQAKDLGEWIYVYVYSFGDMIGWSVGGQKRIIEYPENKIA